MSYPPLVVGVSADNTRVSYDGWVQFEFDLDPWTGRYLAEGNVGRASGTVANGATGPQGLVIPLPDEVLKHNKTDNPSDVLYRLDGYSLGYSRASASDDIVVDLISKDQATQATTTEDSRDKTEFSTTGSYAVYDTPASAPYPLDLTPDDTSYCFEITLNGAGIGQATLRTFKVRISKKVIE